MNLLIPFYEQGVVFLKSKDSGRSRCICRAGAGPIYVN